MVRITKYKDSRFWAVWLEEELLAVVCYKKGALAIKEALEQMNGSGVLGKSKES